MNIWFDLSNSPHVCFFSKMITALREQHNVIVTCRPLANTVELLDMQDFKYHIIGRHYGKSIVKKILGFPIRILQLYSFLKPLSIDVSISHSSFYSPIVSKMLGAPCIYINDNEHAGGNCISFIFADIVMIPEYLSAEKVKRQGASESKLVLYPGVKEGVYLWDLEFEKKLSQNKRETIEKEVKIFIRPEPQTAQYYKGKNNICDELMLNLKEKYSIVLLPRSSEQREYYKQSKFIGINIAERSIPLNDIVLSCDLFIGAGGTMTREAAVMGIPTISIYQDELLDVDRFLIKLGAMAHNPKATKDYVENFLKSNKKSPPNKILLEKGHDAYLKIKKSLLKLGEKKVH